ncbi:MAG: ATP-binding cassette domain-containing protein [Clostridia bacterium]|nr:ATP-binding cassette domain-containing protein [Clostridia bacterium]
MLKLTNVTKIYQMGEYQVNALRGISLAFRESEFVSIIGASGCGKSTMLNIIGGLDRYTTGDLIIGDTSTKDFRAEQWDAYRNATIGFVFQNYNLIPHLTVLENVALALSLSGVTKAERNKRAVEALEKVGMGAELKKKPSQLSGGQMQRVAIARALVNNPKIVLADEPTGALDSELSIQVMNVLKEVAQDRLVIMVTHNNELADTYSTRIIKLNDGLVERDSNPYDWDPLEEENLQYVYSDKYLAEHNDVSSDASSEVSVEKSELSAKDKLLKKLSFLNSLGIGGTIKGSKSPFKATSMKAKTAFQLSLKNLITKKRRTFLTSFAGSIGIISLALVLSMSNGVNVYVDNMQTSILASVPMGIYEYSMDYSVLEKLFGAMESVASGEITNPNLNSGVSSFPTDKEVYIDDGSNAAADSMSSMINGLISQVASSIGENAITDEYVQYIKNMDDDWYKAIQNYYGVQMNILSKNLNNEGTAYEYKDVSPKTKVTHAMNIAMQVLGGNGLEPNNWYQLAGGDDFVGEYYDVIGGRYPTAYNEIVMVVDTYNNISITALEQFGVDVYQRNADGSVVKDENDKPVYRQSISFDDILSQEFKLIYNNDYYTKGADDYFTINSASEELYNKGETLKVVGILRVKPNSMVSFFGSSFCYTSALGERVLNNASNSDVTIAQKQSIESGSDKVIIKGYKFNGEPITTIPIDADIDNKNASSFQIMINMMSFMTDGLKGTSFKKSLGIDTNPVYMYVYPSDFNSKQAINDYLDDWNETHTEDEIVEYFDISEMFIQTVRSVIDLMTYILIAVASISLIVSCVMISIVTSNSVVERTREIGILRSLGARKKDISRVFDAETAIIGSFSGVLGVGIAYALIPLINLIIGNASGVYSLLNLNPIHAVALVILSLGLTILSGLIPSQSAARKNMVDALRIE